MGARDTRPDDLLAAASALASARRQDMETAEEWDDLEHAILAFEETQGPESTPRLDIRSDRIVRRRTLAGGAADENDCDVDDIEQVALAIAAKAGEWFVVDEIATETQRDWITAHIAVEFLKGAGLVLNEGTGHRLIAAEGFTADQALAEFAVATTSCDGPA